MISTISGFQDLCTCRISVLLEFPNVQKYENLLNSRKLEIWRAIFNLSLLDLVAVECVELSTQSPTEKVTSVRA